MVSEDFLGIQDHAVLDEDREGVLLLEFVLDGVGGIALAVELGVIDGVCALHAIDAEAVAELAGVVLRGFGCAVV